MISTVVTSKFDDAMNGAVFISLAFAVIMFGLYVLEEFRTSGYRTRTKAAVSISGMLLGEMILRGWFWIREMHIGLRKIADIMEGYPITSFGKTIEMIGVLCLIKVFAPNHWSKQTWIAVGCTSAIIAAVVANAW